MYFEVTIPDENSQVVNALQIDARNWRSALATALAKTGAPPIDLSGALVTLDGQTVHVMDRRDRRVIQVRQMLDSQVHHPGLIKTGAHPSIGGSAGRVGFTDKATGSFRSISASSPVVPASSVEPSIVATNPEADGRILMQAQAPVAASPSLRRIDAVAPPLVKGAVPAVAPPEPQSDDILEDIFLESPALLESATDLTDACEKMLSFALQKMPAEHGAVFLSEGAGRPLICAAAVGALTDAIGRVELPASSGFTAYTMQTGVSLSITTPANDPRYSPEFARAGIKENSILFACVHDESTYGVVVLLNRHQPNGFSAVEASALAYVGRQLGEYIQALIDAQ